MLLIKTTLYELPHHTHAIRFTPKLEEGGKIISFSSESDRDWMLDYINGLQGEINTLNYYMENSK